jgi:hypothetical protein
LEQRKLKKLGQYFRQNIKIQVFWVSNGSIWIFAHKKKTML